MTNPSEPSHPSSASKPPARPIWRHTSWLFQPIDGSTLAVFRIGFGILLVCEAFRIHSKVQTEFLATKCPFRYDLFDWLPTPSESGFLAIVLALGISATFVAVGLFYRLATITLLFTYTFVFLLEQTLYNNHYYLVSLLCLLFAVTRADATIALSNLFRPNPRHSIARWNVVVFQAQLFIMYFYAGVAKLNDDWLRCEPMRSMLRDRADRFPIEGLLNDPYVVLFFTYGGMIFDLVIGFLLLNRKTRPIAVVLVLLFHLSNRWMFTIGIFPYLGICSTVVFFEPDTPRRVVRWIGRRCGVKVFSDTTSSEGPAVSENTRRVVLTFMGIYFAIQVLIPLRHFLYPGNVSWTEEGHKFAWHMKLRSKDGLFRFYVTDPETGLEQAVDQTKYLTNRQQEEISTRPQLLLRFAHFLRDEQLRQGVAEPVVRVDSLAALNGRPYQFLIDPAVNLAETPRHLLTPASWIVPLEESDIVGDYPETFEERVDRMRAVLRRRQGEPDSEP